ncbi:regulating synaptic membrane exocytosis protein 2 isoform X2 [Parasteatoda tepidariorum]|uniref:regulating synaptic membrane exocytosis protein 2 isoform X2 n=1 Tax=Parasteatoda tepidariorum TaxID=114398 RepID=UPI000A2BFF20|nr:regulating synaptic membrane exocytosis protein 1 isoform X2 [Parasteatoda tepidariorum]
MTESQDHSGGPVPLMQPPFPDLSHLTEDERRIIEGVMFRQQKEEEKEMEILRRKQDEVRILETAIRMRNEEQRRKGIELDATCQICLKTKFADGIGHVCNYCNVRCCARCGGKVSLRSNKVIWVCIVCRKKQELLIKTGQWLHSGMAAKQREIESGEIMSPKQDKRPKLERAHSEGKENVDSHYVLGISRRGSLQQIHRTNSQRELRRQYSQERESAKQESHTDILRYSDRNRPLKDRSPPPGDIKRTRPSEMPSRGDAFSRLHGSGSLDSRGGRYDGTSDPSYDRRRDRYSTDTGDHYKHPSDRDISWKEPQRSIHSTDRRQFGRDQPWISQEEDRKDSSLDRRTSQESLSYHSDRHVRMPYMRGDEWKESPRKRDYDLHSSGEDHRLRLLTSRSDDDRRTHLDPDYASDGRGRGHNNRKKIDAVVRNDSLSSDQSESVRPPPPKPHKNKRGRKLRQRSLSSSDDEIRSTPECSSCEEIDAESESISEKGDDSISAQWKKEDILDAKIKKFLAHPVSWRYSKDGYRLIGHMILKKPCKENMDTSSGAAMLGLRIVGGKILESGQMGAIVEKVVPGSIADTLGRIKIGDEVLEWNGRNLQNKSYEEVFEIIAESRQEPQIELIVNRPMRDLRIDRDQSLRRHTHIGASSSMADREWLASLDPRKQMSLQEDRRPSVLITSPTSPESIPLRPHLSSVGGRILVKNENVSNSIEMKLWYDVRRLQLVVEILSANLQKGPHSRKRNAYLKLYLLPDKREKRRSRTVLDSLCPKWNQTFIFPSLRRTELQSRTLHIICWDYDEIGDNDFIGEVLIDLATARLNNEAEWYRMTTREESLAAQLQRNSMFLEAELSGSLNSVDRLSPSSSISISRLSDSDISELDYDETLPLTRIERTSRYPDIGGSSLSSVGSSPTLVGEDIITAGERRSRRDLWPDDRRRSSTVNPRDMYSYEKFERREPVSGLDYPYRMSSRVRSRSVVPDDGSMSRSRSPPRRVIEANVHRPPSPPDQSVGTTPRQPSGTSSPKKRQLPQIPPKRATRDQMTLELEERARQMKLKMQRKPDGVSTMIVSDSEVSPRHSLDKQFNVHPHPPARNSRLSPHPPEATGKVRATPGATEKDGTTVPALESDESETSSVSKYSVTSAFSSQSEHPRGSRTLKEFTSPTPGYGPVHPPRPSRGSLNRSNSDGAQNEKTNNGSLSDTALAGTSEKSTKQGQQGTSTGGHKKRMGFRRKKSSTINVHRSEEVAPLECRHLVKQASSVSSDGEGSLSGDSSVWLPSIRLVPEGEFSNFVEGLGAGQLVGRQVLASPSLGDIQLSLADRKGNLEVEVIRARGLQPKSGKVVPAPYVKVYLVKGRKCVAKRKTASARKTLDPLYQQQLVFQEDYRNCILQVTVWGDYGRIEKKVFMGVAQIMLDELDLSNFVISWYKLFHHSSLINLPASVPQNSMISVDSFG